MLGHPHDTPPSSPQPVTNFRPYLAGEPHQALHPFSVDDMALGRQPRRHPPRAIIRPHQIMPIAMIVQSSSLTEVGRR